MNLRWLPLIVFCLLAQARVGVADTVDADERTLPGPRDPVAEFQADETRAALDQAALTALVEARFPYAEDSATRSRIDFYLAQTAPDLQVQSLAIAIDGGAPRTTELGGDQSEALAERHGPRPAGNVDVEPGAHQLHFEIVARTPQSAADGSRLRLTIDDRFEIPAEGLAVQITLDGGGLISSPSASIERLQPKPPVERGWLSRTVRNLAGGGEPDAYERGSEEDPAMRAARFLLKSDEPEAAIVELKSLARGLTDRLLPDEHEFLLAQAYRQARMFDQALASCDRLQRRRADRSKIAVERLRVAEARYEQDELPQAQAALQVALPDLPEISLLEGRFLQAQLWLVQNRSAEALKLLNRPESGYMEAMRFMAEAPESLRAPAYRRYNLGISLINNGQESRGLSWLDLVGRLRTRDKELQSLRDKANLTLGWYFLKHKQGTTALGALGRVRREGQFANAALLGVGWAQIEPAGQRISRRSLASDSGADQDLALLLPPTIQHSLVQLGVLEPELYGEIVPRSFAREKPPTDRRVGLRRAAKFWSELAQGDGSDPAVQEGAIAVGYAYDQLHDLEHARTAYTAAIAMLEPVDRKLTADAASVADGRFVGSITAAPDRQAVLQLLGNLDLTPATSTTAFYHALARYQDCAGVQRLLQQAIADATLRAQAAASPASQAAADRLAELKSLQAQFLTEQAADARKVQGLALQHLQGREHVLDEYLKALYFAAARVDDRSSAQGN